MPHEVAAVRRHREIVNDAAYADGRRHRHDWHPDSSEEQRRQIVGWLGEYATAKHLGVKYHFATNYQWERHDVAGLEVRSTERVDGGHLITYPDDKPAPYVLALVHRISVHKFDVVLAGWIDLADANTDRHWRTNMRSPAYWTPQAALHPMATLGRVIQLEGSSAWLGN
jgi:hypothetical protein